VAIGMRTSRGDLRPSWKGARNSIVACALLCWVMGLAGQTPLEPRRFDPKPSRDQRLPPPYSQEQETFELRVLSAETFDRSADGKEVVARGVTFEYRGYRVTADEAIGNVEEEVFALRGNVNVLGQTEVVRGNTVIVNFRARTFRMEAGDVDLRKALFKGRVLTDLYVGASEVEGSEGLFLARGGSVTGCDYANAHYSFDARVVRVVPDRKVGFEGVKVRALGRTLLTVPRFEIPLQRRTGGILPDVGQNETEGFYAKFRYGFPVGQDSGVLRFDIMSKRGIAGGVLFDYASRLSKGFLQAYSDFDRNAGRISFTGSAQHQQRFGSLLVDARHESSRFSFLTGLSTETHRTGTQLSLLNQRGASTRLSFSRTENAGNFSRSVSNSVTFVDQRRWSSALGTNLTVSLNAARSRSGTFTVERQVVDTRLTATYDAGVASAELAFNRNIPIGENQNFVAAIEQLPVITFRSDRRRLIGDRSRLPDFTVALSAGNYRDNFAQRDVGRYLFDIRTRGGRQAQTGFLYQFEAGFLQGFYSDDTAQYVPSLNATFGYRMNERAATTLRYNYRRQHGFTPLSFDRTGSFHVASLDSMTEVVRGLRLGGQVGFDFNRDRQGQIAWQSPAVRLEYEPSRQFRFRALANYLPDRREWGSLRMDAAGQFGDFRFGVSGRYDGIRNRWGSVNLYFDGLTLGRLRLATLLRYNGFLNRFDAAHFSFIYDLHCAEAVLQVLDTRTGFRPGREVVFLIRLKALPFSSSFGVGRGGQPLDLGTGGF